MEKLGFFCKSHYLDIQRLRVLVESFNEFNVDQLRLIISVPISEIEMFEGLFSEFVAIIGDEEYAKDHFVAEAFDQMSIGYLNQQICKLCFTKLEYFENYVCLDSDSFFIRPFHTKDFMYDDHTPFTVLTQDKDLAVEPFYRDKYWTYRREKIKKVYDFFGLNDSRQLSCHNTQVFNIEVLKRLHQICDSENMTIADLLRIAPYEFAWYNVCLLKYKDIDIIQVEPFFKMFHMRYQYNIFRLQNITVHNIAQEYVGIIMNNRWKPRKTPFKYGDPNIFTRGLSFILRWCL